MIMLKLYNTLSRKKEAFRSIVAGKVGVYSCGPTRKIYKPFSIFNLSNLRVVNILPGDLCGRQMFFCFNNILGGFARWNIL